MADNRAHDPYSVLGVSPDASQEEIRSAFRYLAKKFHPDANPGDHNAEEWFKKIGVAWDILGDPEKRRGFDLDRARGASPARATRAEEARQPKPPPSATPHASSPSATQEETSAAGARAKSEEWSAWAEAKVAEARSAASAAEAEKAARAKTPEPPPQATGDSPPEPAEARASPIQPQPSRSPSKSKPNWFLRLGVGLQVAWVAVMVPMWLFTAFRPEVTASKAWSVAGAIWAVFFSLLLYRSRSKAYPKLMMGMYAVSGVLATIVAVNGEPGMLVGAVLCLLFLVFMGTQQEYFQRSDDDDGLVVLSVLGILVTVGSGFVSGFTGQSAPPSASPPVAAYSNPPQVAQVPYIAPAPSPQPAALSEFDGLEKACTAYDLAERTATPTECMALAKRYGFGDGVEKNGAIQSEIFAATCLRDTREADPAMADACDLLGYSYERGFATTFLSSSWFGYKPEREVAAFKKGCRLGSSEACFYLAQLVALGRKGEKKNPQQALSLLEQSCSRGTDLSCLWAGKMLEGEDDEIAACSGEKSEACDLVAVRAEAGQGLPRDPSAAVTLYKSACRRGDADGCEYQRQLELKLSKASAADDSEGDDANRKQRLPSFVPPGFHYDPNHE